MTAGGTHGAWRWLVCLAAIILGPAAVVTAMIVADHLHPFRSALAGWSFLFAAWAVGIAGVHFLPLTRVNRGVIAILCTPLIGYVMFVAGVSISCFWYHSCL